jgi:hypothetical protein
MGSREQVADDPIAEGPGGAWLVVAEAVSIGVAGEVEPGGCPAFAAVGGGEQAIDLVLPGGLRVDLPGGLEGIELGEGRRWADEVYGQAAEQQGGAAWGSGVRTSASRRASTK